MRFVALLISLSITFNCIAYTHVISVKTSLCQTKEVHESYNAIGRIQATNKQEFFANVTGNVDFVSPKQGEIVEAGEVIFAIERELAESTKQQAIDKYNKALLKLKRNQILYTKKLISDEAFEQSETEVSSTNLNLQQALKTYKNMVFIAPFQGILGATNYVVGNYITPSQEAVINIVDASSPKLAHFYLPEGLIDKIDLNTDIYLKLNGEVITSKVTAKSPYLSKENGGFLVSATIDPNLPIPDGLIISGEFKFNKHKALVVPEESLGKSNQGDFLYLVIQEKNTSPIAHKIRVCTGLRNDGLVEVISSELNEGAIVVSEGMHKLSDKAKIQIIDK